MSFYQCVWAEAPSAYELEVRRQEREAERLERIRAAVREAAYAAAAGGWS